MVRRTGPPLTPQTEALLGWVAREAVTNAVRHSGATRCEFVVDSTPERVRLTVTDDGRGPDPDGAARAAGAVRPVGGTGLKGLTERLAVAGGRLEAGPGPRGGFVVRAELPVAAPDEGAGAEGAGDEDREPAPGR